MTKLHNAVHGFAKQFLPDLHHLPSHTGAKNALFFLGLFGFMTMAFSEVSANVNISTSLNNNVMTIEKLRVTTDGQVNSPWKVELDTNGIRLDLGSPVGVLKRNSAGYITQGVVNGNEIDNGAIGTNHIQNGAVGSAQIASGSISTSQIQNGAITCDKLNIPGFTCSGVTPPNSACPSGQFLQGLSASGGAICAPIPGGPGIIDCPVGQSPIMGENGQWTCGTQSLTGDQLWTKQSFRSPHIYNKNRNGGRVGVGLTTPQTTLHVKGTFLVERKDGAVGPNGSSNYITYIAIAGSQGNSNGYNFSAYPGIQPCSCETSPCTTSNSTLLSNDVGQYCYNSVYVGGSTSNGTSAGGSATSSWQTTIYQKNKTTTTAQEGESCYGSRAGSRYCAEGLVCRDAQGNNPMEYDGVGTCVKDTSTNSCGTRYVKEIQIGEEEFNKLNEEYNANNGEAMAKCSCDTSRQGQQCTKELFIGNNVGKMCYDENQPGPTEKRLGIFHVYQQEEILGPDCAEENACTNTGNINTTNSLALADPSAIFYVGQNAVGILTKNPQYTLDVVGVVRAAQVLTLSDARLKTDITPINNALKKLMGIEGYIYTLTVDGSTQYGVLAQQVEEFFPYAVTTAENGLKSVNYNGLIAPMIQAIHELDKKVQTLEKTYQNNESRIKAIEKRLTK